MVGRDTLSKRFEKIKRFRDKRESIKSAPPKQKVDYDCRKVVANNRLRIKGRFIRKEE